MHNRSVSGREISAGSLNNTPYMIRRVSPESWSSTLIIKRSISEPSGGQHPSIQTSLPVLGWGQTLQRQPQKTWQLTPSPLNGPRQFSYLEPDEMTCSMDGYLPDSKDLYGSILKKHKYVNGSSIDGTIRRSQHVGRKVAFKNSVSVHWYDSDADSVSSPTESDRFSQEPARDVRSNWDRTGKFPPKMVEFSRRNSDDESYDRTDMRDTLNKKRHETLAEQSVRNSQGFPTDLPSSLVGTNRQVVQETLPPLLSESRRRHACVTPRVISVSSVPCPRFTFVQEPDTLREKLVVTVQLNPELRPNDVVVKANKNGNKIRVVISKDINLGNQTGHNNAKEHIPLPVVVDPYQLSARLDRDGVLHIEAPIVQ